MCVDDYFYYDGDAIHFPKHDFSKEANKDDLDKKYIEAAIDGCLIFLESAGEEDGADSKTDEVL